MNCRLIDAAVLEYCPSNPSENDIPSLYEKKIGFRYNSSAKENAGVAVRLCAGRHEEYYLARIKGENFVISCGRNTLDTIHEDEFVSSTDWLQESLWYRFDRHVERVLKAWAKELANN